MGGNFTLERMILCIQSGQGIYFTIESYKRMNEAVIGLNVKRYIGPRNLSCRES